MCAVAGEQNTPDAVALGNDEVGSPRIRLKNLVFVPASRVAYNFAKVWAVAVEEYDDFGPVHKFNAVSDQSHQIYAVVDRTGGFLDVEAGAGFGMTDGSDKFQLKLILSRDLNAPRKSQ